MELSHCEPIDASRRCRNVLAFLHLADQQHVRALAIDVEPLGSLVLENGRREGAEALAELDLQVHPLPVLLVACVGQDAACPE